MEGKLIDARQVQSHVALEIWQLNSRWEEKTKVVPCHMFDLRRGMKRVIM